MTRPRGLDGRRRPPIVHRDDVAVQMSIRVPGWLKNRVAAEAEKNFLTMNRWVAGVLLRAVESGEGFPEAPPAEVPLPTLENALRAYLTGEELIEPCGQASPCERAEVGVSVVDGMSFCNHCRIRVE